MADKKISALDPATTPLAGTEVLPLVQSGVTKKVATNDLTVKNVRSNATTGILQIAGPGTGTTRVMTTPDANFTAARTDAGQTFTGDQIVQGNNRASTTYGNLHIQSDSNPASFNGGTLSFGGKSVATGNQYIFGGVKFSSDPATVTGWDTYATLSLTNADSSVSEKVYFYNNGNVTLNTGNLVIGTDGKGIDFTATPGAGTSELLDDYEEGTWTPALTFGGAAVDMVGTFTGTYTKIGDMVTVWGKIALTAKGLSTGSALITGLPFTVATQPSSSSDVIDPITGMANLIAGGCIFTVVSSTVVYPMFQSSTTRSQITEQFFTDSSQIAFSSTYKV
jgi:hypothetical protein